MVLGITGGSGCGTTTVGRLLEARGFYFIDADRVYHELLAGDEALRADLTARFGGGIVKDGAIDRRALAKIVFSDAAALTALNDITHAVIIRKVSELIGGCGKAHVAVEAVALIESGMGKLCDAVVGVLCDDATRLRRSVERDAISEDEARARIAAQKNSAFFIDHCDYILLNDRTQEELSEAVDALLQAIGSPQTP